MRYFVAYHNGQGSSNSDIYIARYMGEFQTLEEAAGAALTFQEENPCRNGWYKEVGVVREPGFGKESEYEWRTTDDFYRRLG